jgi:hypothetical protein
MTTTLNKLAPTQDRRGRAGAWRLSLRALMGSVTLPSELVGAGDTAGAVTKRGHGPETAAPETAPTSPRGCIGATTVASPTQTHRALAVLAAVGLFVPAVSAWTAIAKSLPMGLMGVGLSGGALIMIGLVASARDEARLERLDLWLLALGLLALLGYVVAQTTLGDHYVTDEGALVHAAALSLIHGHDPYSVGLASSLSSYGVQAPTYLMTGGAVHTLGYPGLPVLLVAPVVALRPDAPAIPLVNAAALSVAAVAMFFVLPRQLRPLSVIACVGTVTLPFFAYIGLSGVIMLAALTVVASRWREFGDQGRLGTSGRVRAVALGLAASVNQLVWFLIPFLLIGIFLTRLKVNHRARAARTTTLYAGLALGTFMAVNLVFIVWDAGSWFSGVMAPITQHAVPFGQGLVNLSEFAGVGGGALDFYSYAAICLYLALLVLFAVRFDRLSRCCFLLPILSLYLSDRSLSSYWLLLTGVVAVSVLTDTGVPDTQRTAVPPGWRGLWKSPVATSALFAPAAACLLVAFLTPAPLQMRIISTQVSQPGPANRVAQLIVSVRNTSDQAVHPWFAVDTTSLISGFWQRWRGPARLAPHSSARYVLRAPRGVLPPEPRAPFVVQAVTDQPRAISASRAVWTSGSSIAGNHG